MDLGKSGLKLYKDILHDFKKESVLENLESLVRESNKDKSEFIR